MHTKRSKMPRTWPLPRKGKRKRYLATPDHSTSKGIPVLFIIRDLLKIANTRKEVKHLVLAGEVKVNNRVRKSESFPVQVFDVISFDKTKKNYRLEIVNRKFKLKEVSEKEADKKVVRIFGKKILSKDKIQMNLEDGQNLISKDNFSVGDSVIVNTKSNKIEKILPLKEGAKIEVISGKHAGEKGTLKGIEKLTRGNIYVIKLKAGEVSLPLKTLLVIE